MRYIDIGLNLFSEQFAGREEEIFRRSYEEFDTAFIITGSSLKSSAGAVAFAGDHVGVYATAGVHPHDAKQWKDRDRDVLGELLGHPRVVAVGECGLDYDRMYSPAEVQRRVFEEQITLAEELEKPLFLHERAASEDFARILGRHRGICSRAVVHCYTGDGETARKYLELGCMIGITGWVCDHRRNSELLEALKVIPAERLMAETDGPYLLPRGIKGIKSPNLPENIRFVVERLALEKGMEEEQLRQQILENTKRFFGILE